MTRSAFLRARRPEHKQQRREEILAAARRLASEVGVRNVSLGGVASAVGLAKSNVARYFGTREEIYLELTVEEWLDWSDEVAARLATAAGPDDVIAALADTLTERPLFCDLLGHVSITLEHNISVPAARAFKRAMLGVVDDLGARVALAYPGLTTGEGVELAGAAAALAGTLFPMANPPPALRELYAQDPDIAARCLPFQPTMRRMLAALAVGLPTQR
ncbi:TetR/AcrR family transcriptional regulator [Nonomuraea aurantiaca]|uniref:TetR/AcrR family transcriptional regulator n=1 Tax=Nonomuraea aurantiaca TaxID=2878562 RepID=UPI001CD9E7DD|nr:TetR family transcriptional regulator [Nonomuraea aurantiaca]MCA2224042.1 TetR family transcriptional regulator [Nonomuraea aurantiaca]